MHFCHLLKFVIVVISFYNENLALAINTSNCTDSLFIQSSYVSQAWASSVFTIKSDRIGSKADISFPPAHAYDGIINQYNFYQSACFSSQPQDYCQHSGQEAMQNATDLGYHWLLLEINEPVIVSSLEIKSRTFNLESARRSASIQIFLSYTKPFGDLTKFDKGRIIGNWSNSYWRYCGTSAPLEQITKPGELINIHCLRTYFPAKYVLLRRKQSDSNDPLCCLSFHEVFVKGFRTILGKIVPILSVKGDLRVGNKMSLICEALPKQCPKVYKYLVYKICRVTDFTNNRSQCVTSSLWDLYNLSIFQTGVYYCEIRIKILKTVVSRSENIIVRVVQPAVNRLLLNTEDSYENNTTTYYCLSQGGYPAPKHILYSVSNGNTQMLSNSSLLSVQTNEYLQHLSYYLYSRQTTGTMKINRNQNGLNILCNISQNGLVIDTEKRKLQVYFPSVSQFTPTNVPMRSASTATSTNTKQLICVSTEGNPPPKHDILVNGKPNDERIVVTKEMSLGINGGQTLKTKIEFKDDVDSVECVVDQGSKFQTQILNFTYQQSQELKSNTKVTVHLSKAAVPLIVSLLVVFGTVLLAVLAYFCIRNHPISAIFSYSPVNTVNEDDVVYL